MRNGEYLLSDIKVADEHLGLAIKAFEEVDNPYNIPQDAYWILQTLRSAKKSCETSIRDLFIAVEKSRENNDPYIGSI
jgi:hypothetical protein